MEERFGFVPKILGLKVTHHVANVSVAKSCALERKNKPNLQRGLQLPSEFRGNFWGQTKALQDQCVVCLWSLMEGANDSKTAVKGLMQLPNYLFTTLENLGAWI